MKSEALAAEILRLVGSSANVCKAGNCMTRLRLELKQQSPDLPQKLKALDGILGTHMSGAELQIILGPGRAASVTKHFKALIEEENANLAEVPRRAHTAADGDALASPSLREAAQNSTIGDGKALHETIRRKNATPVKLFLKRIANIFIPLIPAFIACGIITGLLNIALKAFPAFAATPQAGLLALMGNAVFFGMNILVGVNAAKEFGGSPMLGGTLAVILSHPGLAAISLDGVPFVPRRGGIIAVLLVTALAAWLEKKLHQCVPEMLDLFLTPLLVLLIAGFAALFILQPLGGIISEWVGQAATSAIDKGGALTGFLLGAAWLPMVMLGVHQALTPIHAELLSRYGVTVLLPVLAMAGAGQVGAALCVYCRTKNAFLKKTVVTALPVGILGIGEPLIYGVTLPLGRPFLGACIGGACGGAVQAAFMVGAAAMGISGLPLAAVTDNIPIYLGGLLTAYAAGFFATWLLGFQDPEEAPNK